jgi:putative salt-induced outer membrane protein
MKLSPVTYSVALAMLASGSTLAQTTSTEQMEDVKDVLEPTSVEMTSNRADMSDSLSSDWSGSAGFGAVVTGGNSDTQNLAGSINISRRDDIWRHNAFGSLYKAESNDVESANRFDLGYKLDREINEVMYGFGRLRYDSDDFGNIDGRFTGIVGVGRTFIDDGKVSFNGEAGIGAHQTDYITLVDGEDSADGAVFYLGLGYQNQLMENLTFNSIFNAEVADSNTYTVWDNSLNFQLSDRVSLNIGLLSRANSDIEGELGKKTDTTTRWSINYGI